MVHSFTGAQYNSKTYASLLLVDNNLPFVANYPFASFIFTNTE